ncbi:hypothetical protein NE865_04712 [Phthorimaea operculella]|nr:hypothetical protein NE865_04712 [Phthorimaea operculella]
MRVEIPDFTRCCVCVPLRYGVLTFGYLNLGFTIFLLSIEIWMTVVFDKEYTVSEILQSSTTYMYRGVVVFSQMWFILIVYGLEVIFNVILLIGAHSKRTQLIRAYYYYGITTCLAAFVSYVAVRNDPVGWRSFDHHVVEFCFAFSGLVLQVYLLFLIRSELKKLENKTQMRFVNHASEVYMVPCYSEEGRPLSVF